MWKGGEEGRGSWAAAGGVVFCDSLLIDCVEEYCPDRRGLRRALNHVLPSFPVDVAGAAAETERRAMSGILKRRFEEVSSSPCSSLRESDYEVSCSESGDSSDSVNPSASGTFTRESPGSHTHMHIHTHCSLPLQST